MKIQTAPRHLAATHRDNCEQAHPQTKHTHTHICMHARTHAHTNTCTHAGTHKHKHTHTHTHTHTNTHEYSVQTYKKRALNPITDGCEPPCGCWELNSGLLEEQSVLLTAEPSLQTQSFFLSVFFFFVFFSFLFFFFFVF